MAAGDHPVARRVREPNGGFDTQSYTLTILNPNEAPVVNAGDDRLVSTGSAASLNGTATDDGFPRNATLAINWSKVSGPGAVSFDDPGAPTKRAIFPGPGTSLRTILRLDSSVGELANLPPNWHAWRRTPEEPWQRARLRE